MTSDLLDSVLAMPSTSVATNFYLEGSDGEGEFRTTASQRRDRLLAHVRAVNGGDVVIVGEAPGWKGARQSGVPFTSARSVGLEGNSEPSATIVHGALAALGLAGRALLWNAFPLHPHHPGSPRSNRTPTREELSSGRVSLEIAIRQRRIICVGEQARKSVQTLLDITVPDTGREFAGSRAVAVRHPANGGARGFRSGLAAVAEAWRL